MVSPKDSIFASLFVLLIVSASTFTRAAFIEYNFTLSYGFWAPDCVNKQVILINGAYPGPTVYATEGDTLRVNVKNMLATEGTSIHWHGIRQFKSCHMDGAAYVTECPIPTLETFAYEFVVDKAGSFLYHGHHGLQSAAGLYGKLIVREKNNRYPYVYSGEFSLITNDWYHRSIYEISGGLDNNPLILLGDPQSVVINGKAKYNCSWIPTQTATIPGGDVSGDVLKCNSSSSNTQCGREVFKAAVGRTYRFRLLNAATFLSHNIIFEGHTMFVVEADQHLVIPFKATSLDLYSGQNIDVLITPQKVGNYWISVGLRGRDTITPHGLAILNVGGVDVADPTSTPPNHPAWNDTDYGFRQATKFRSLSRSNGGDTPKVPQKSSREIQLIASQGETDGYHSWALNNVTHSLPETPYLHAYMSGESGLYDETTPEDKLANPWDLWSPPPIFAVEKSDHVFKFKINSTVDIILQNACMLTQNKSEPHPFHMHGHHFWVLGHGKGIFKDSDRAKFNTKNPSMRNTVPLLPFGWTAIRLYADNPGTWFMHCHILVHHYMGMAIVFFVGEPSDIPALPYKTRKCGKLF